MLFICIIVPFRAILKALVKYKLMFLSNRSEHVQIQNDVLSKRLLLLRTRICPTGANQTNEVGFVLGAGGDWRIPNARELAKLCPLVSSRLSVCGHI
jgi:hypothetical protein